MIIRPTQSSLYDQVRLSLMHGLANVMHAQQPVSTGKNFVQPSDNPFLSAQASSYKLRIGALDRNLATIQTARVTVDSGASSLQDATGVLSEARALALQGMNGTLAQTDRDVIADQIEAIRDQLLDLANVKAGQRYVFGGTQSSTQPFVDGGDAVSYEGSSGEFSVQIGSELTLGIALPGSDVFGRNEASGLELSGQTGVAAGTEPYQGQGYDTLVLRHDATTTTLGAGIALVANAPDTILGAHAVVVDATARTVQLGNGPAVTLPPPGDPALADVVVKDGNGAEVHLDFSAWTGVDNTGSVNGAGSASLDGTTWTALDFADANLEISDSKTGSIIHIDATRVQRSGNEQLVFGGNVNVFDVLQGMADTLRDVDRQGATVRLDRMNHWLGELDRHAENVTASMGVLGGRSQRLSSLEASFGDQKFGAETLLSGVEDADPSQSVLELTRAEQTLELSQSASARMLQLSLLNFLR